MSDTSEIQYSSGDGQRASLLAAAELSLATSGGVEPEHVAIQESTIVGVGQWRVSLSYAVAGEVRSAVYIVDLHTNEARRLDADDLEAA